MLAVPVAVIVVLIYIIVNISTVSISQLPLDQEIIRIVRNIYIKNLMKAFIKSTFHMSMECGLPWDTGGQYPSPMVEHTSDLTPLMLPSHLLASCNISC